MIGLTTQAFEHPDKKQYLANPLRSTNPLESVNYAAIDGANNGIRPIGFKAHPDFTSESEAKSLRSENTKLATPPQTVQKNVQWAFMTGTLFVLGTRFASQQPIDESTLSEIARLSAFIFIAKQFFHNDLSLYE